MQAKKVIYVVVLASLMFVAGMLASNLQKRFGSDSDDKTTPQSVSASSSNHSGEVVLSARTQQLSGIATDRLKASRSRIVVEAYGQVLDVQGLIELRNAYATGKANVQKADAQLMVSRNEYDRVKTLYKFNKNVSIKDLQSAEASYDSDIADSSAAVQNLAGLVGEMRQEWGKVITNWVTSKSQIIRSLMDNELSLILITLHPLDATKSVPSNVDVETPDGRTVRADFVSNSPRTNAAIQGINYFYLVPAGQGLSSGTNVVAYVPLGPEKEGVILPDSALVWWNGAAWVYREITNVAFRRERVSLTDHVAGGWFVTETLKPGDKIVVRGAQMLLSQEFSTQAGSGGDESD